MIEQHIEPANEAALIDPALVAALQRMPLFEAFSLDQLHWLVTHAEVVVFEARERIFTEDLPSTDFWALIEGEWRITRVISGRETTLNTTDQPGTWGGTIPWVNNVEPISGQALRRSRFLRIHESVLEHMLTGGFPIVRHILAGLVVGVRNFEGLVRQQEKLAALGKLSAGLAHELNNPASAARSAAGRLDDVFDQMQSSALALACLDLSLEQRQALDHLRRDATARAQTVVPLGALEQSDREDALLAWLDAHGIADGWQLSGTFASAGLDTAWLDSVAAAIPAEFLGEVLVWLHAGLTGRGLASEIEESTQRISELVGAVKSYTYMDQAARQEIDVHAGLESTLTMLAHKLKSVTVTRDYERNLPRITAYASELNQVWTNLIDNAIDATDGNGHLLLRTARDDNAVQVEIVDDGPGIPREIQDRIWEPFFTTKGVGEGTGLGLDVAYRIVVGRHNGTISVTSTPGHTCFRVCLPINDPDAV